jgi:hypothetical protein
LANRHIIREAKIKRIFLLISIVFLSGCATYNFHYGKAPHDKGYVVWRDNYPILEYTIGKDNNVPDFSLAKERFKRRRKIVEHYYKKMGYIENHFKMAFWDPCVMFLKLIGGVFRLPFIAISDYRYGHNPEYKANIDRREEVREVLEEARIGKLKEKLNIYIQKDLGQERF